MSPEGVVSIIVALLGAGGIGVIREWWRDRKRAPIDAATAVVAMSQTVGQQALAMVEQLQEELERLRVERAQDRAMVASIRTRLDQLEQSWQAWYHRMVAEWSTIRQQSVPPDPPQVTLPSASIIEP